MSKGIDHLSSDRYALASRLFDQALNTIKSIIDENPFSFDTVRFYDLPPLAFGKGLSEGLIKYHSSIDKSLDYLSFAAYKLHRSVCALNNPIMDHSILEIHTNFGEGLGLLGLKRKGLKLLDNSLESNVLFYFSGKKYYIQDMIKHKQ